MTDKRSALGKSSVDDGNLAAGMTTRTTRSRVTFAAPALIRGIHGPVPAGSYDLEVEEDVIEGNAHTVRRRVATILYLPAGGVTVSCTIDPGDLAAALARDAATQTKTDTDAP